MPQQWSLAFFGLLVCLPSLAAAADLEVGCDAEEPLISRSWDFVSLEHDDLWLGEWRLPISAQRPNLLTLARTRISVSKASSSGPWQARLAFRFEDSCHPLGLPFNFRKITLGWEVNGQRKVRVFDWCSATSPSLFPGQEWSLVFDLEDPSEARLFRKMTLRLWGSRN
jgi:hypothetical protein